MKKAVVAFLIAERSVDALLEAVADTSVARLRWFIVGRDIPLLGALVAHWGHAMDVSVLHLPPGRTASEEATLLMLECEALAPGDCVWLVEGRREGAPAAATAIVDIADVLPAELADLVLAGAGGT